MSNPEEEPPSLPQHEPTPSQLIASVWKWVSTGAIAGLLAPFAAVLQQTLDSLLPATIIAIAVGVIGGAIFGYIRAHHER